MSQKLTLLPSVATELSWPEHFVLGATRLWRAEYVRTANPYQLINRFFSYCGMVKGAQSLNALLYRIAISTGRPLHIKCVRCQPLTADEERIVHAVGFAQAARLDAASKALAVWLPVSEQRISLSALSGLAEALVQERMIVPVRPWQAIDVWHRINREAENAQEIHGTVH